MTDIKEYVPQHFDLDFSVWHVRQYSNHNHLNPLNHSGFKLNLLIFRKLTLWNWTATTHLFLRLVILMHAKLPVNGKSDVLRRCSKSRTPYFQGFKCVRLCTSNSKVEFRCHPAKKFARQTRKGRLFWWHKGRLDYSFSSYNTHKLTTAANLKIINQKIMKPINFPAK